MILSTTHQRALALLRERGPASTNILYTCGATDEMLDELFRWKLVKLVPGHETAWLELTEKGRLYATGEYEPPAMPPPKRLPWQSALRCTSRRRRHQGKPVECGKVALSTGANGEPRCVWCAYCDREESKERA